jgi:hypothetical protein
MDGRTEPNPGMPTNLFETKTFQTPNFSPKAPAAKPKRFKPKLSEPTLFHPPFFFAEGACGEPTPSVRVHPNMERTRR